MWYNMLIEWVFGRMFKGYAYDFLKSDAKIMAMKDAERVEYYRQAKDLLENRGFVQEMQDLIRRYYAELALKTGSKLEMQAYRLTLKALQDFETRVRQLSCLYQPPSINEMSKKL